MNGRVWAVVPHLTGPWHRNCPALRVTNQGSMLLRCGQMRKFLFITRIQREKSTLGQSLCISPTHSPSDSCFGARLESLLSKQALYCRLRSRESGVLRLVIPDFFRPDPESHPVPLTAQNLFLSEGV